ncbi:heme A synthase [Limnohabitans sp. T6-5]|uniref:COX15/CtaA family protein n=1 Tax=Limnohabitans sp. T6-5 TaxID=1100724 RepID=UPI000D3859B9|nr:COX15/CtaA family protein [Limnohabitans sp. T6-5]PUE09211.1 heme A synthase [Limnohabitans sp. T6-5]
MEQVNLFNWAPVLQIMGAGLAVAVVPLTWSMWRNRQTSASGRLQTLTLLTLFLTFDLILFGAFTRLTDSGLGCPDWPGCYGSATPLGAQMQIHAAQAALPTGPVTHGKAWVEMVHRYMATGVGVLILSLTVLTWRQKHSHPLTARNAWWPVFTLVWVCVQGAFGALTVTMKLFPAIVTLHLLFGIGLLALLTAQTVQNDDRERFTLPVHIHRGLIVAWVLVWLQIALGGWVSTNYAVLACSGFPSCNGSWWPVMDGQGFGLWRELGHDTDGQLLPFAALTAIHYVHRSAAWLVLTVLLWLGWRLRAVEGMSRLSKLLLILVGLQLITGMSNVVLDWPLVSAIAHTGGASAMVVVLTWALRTSRTTTSLHSAAYHVTGASSFDSRPAA